MGAVNDEDGGPPWPHRDQSGESMMKTMDLKLTSITPVYNLHEKQLMPRENYYCYLF